MNTEPEIYTGRTLDAPKSNDMCFVVTDDRKVHEGRYLGEIDGIMILGSHYFASTTCDRAIPKTSIMRLKVLGPMSSTMTECDYNDIVRDALNR